MAGGNGQRIMVVDNDRTVLEMLHIRLEVARYRVFIERNGREALEKVGQVWPAAMIIDANLGDADGFEIVSAIRARYPELHFPILMTGRELTADNVRRTLVCGAQYCMAKPYSGSDAVEKISRLLQRAPASSLQSSAERPVAYI